MDQLHRSLLLRWGMKKHQLGPPVEIRHPDRKAAEAPKRKVITASSAAEVRQFMERWA
jgi:hypothetical protein